MWFINGVSGVFRGALKEQLSKIFWRAPEEMKRVKDAFKEFEMCLIKALEVGTFNTRLYRLKLFLEAFQDS